MCDQCDHYGQAIKRLDSCLDLREEAWRIKKAECDKITRRFYAACIVAIALLGTAIIFGYHAYTGHKAAREASVSLAMAQIDLDRATFQMRQLRKEVSDLRNGRID